MINMNKNNVPAINWYSYLRTVNILYEVEIGLWQIVKDFARITQNSKTLIDLIYTNDKDAQVVVSRTPKISDHDILVMTKKA